MESELKMIKIDSDFNYNATKLLGAGGFGKVFEGTWCGEKVAVKRVQLLDLSDSREEDALTKLNHQNVTKLHYAVSDHAFR